MKRLVIGPRRLWSRQLMLSRFCLSAVSPGRDIRRPSPVVGLSGQFRNLAEMRTHASSRGAAADDGSANGGQECYDQAIQAMKRAEQLEEERESKKSADMYQAWQKASKRQEEYEAANVKKENDKASVLQGVAVVKTIVKQARKEHKQQLHNKSKASGKDESLDIGGGNDAAFWKRRGHGLLRKAALSHEHPQALILLGNQELESAKMALLDDNPAVVRKAVASALDLYRRAGLQGAPEGWFNVGQLMWTGYPDVSEEETNITSGDIILERNRCDAMGAFRKAISLGDPDAMYFLGVTLLSEVNHDDVKEGLGLIEDAARIGHGPARYYSALLHLNGNEALQIPPCTTTEFMQYLDAAADAENPDALFLRGHLYHQGENGYPLNYARALADFLAAADRSNADAAVSAGAMLHSGRPGVARDQKRAFELYQIAGEMGSTEGWRNVVACYALGEGVPKSESTAKYIAKTMLKEEGSL